MTATSLLIVPTSSKLRVRTRASGMLARLAHDLEIVAKDLSGRATLEGDGFSGELVVPVAALEVVGVLHGDRVDPSSLSGSDRAEIARKIREEVFSGTREIRARVRGASRQRADVTVEIQGRDTVSVPLGVKEDGDRVEVSGRVELSMKRLGLREVKGPLGAFRVRDGVEVIFELTLRPEGQAA